MTGVASLRGLICPQQLFDFTGVLIESQLPICVLLVDG